LSPLFSEQDKENMVDDKIPNQCRENAMLMKGWTKEISRAECRPAAQTVHYIARLDQNIGEVIPYLNAVLGSFSYIKEPPSVTFRSQDNMISVHADHIAINALQDGEEAEKILRWLQAEVNVACCPRRIAASAASPPVLCSLPWQPKAARTRMTARHSSPTIEKK